MCRTTTSKQLRNFNKVLLLMTILFFPCYILEESLVLLTSIINYIILIITPANDLLHDWQILQ